LRKYFIGLEIFCNNPSSKRSAACWQEDPPVLHGSIANTPYEQSRIISAQ
jgi:hypothetical protein